MVLSDSEDDVIAGSSSLASAFTRKRLRRDSLADRISAGSKVSLGQNLTRPTTTLHAPFMRIVSQLLHSPTAPVLLPPAVPLDPEDVHPYTRRLLAYFSYFLRIYSVDCSLRHDYLSALAAALSHYTLNCRKEVTVFAQNSWNDLVRMWATKDGEKSEDVVAVLRMLFPVLVADTAAATQDNQVTALETLWLTAESIATRMGSLLKLDALRLRVSGDVSCEFPDRAFASTTFQHGWGVTRAQALVWGSLQLQADSVHELYIHDESTYRTVKSGKKKKKMESPMSSVLHSIRSRMSRETKIHHLQVLLFFAERHWLSLHQELRRDIITSLTSLVSFEDADIQSWTFLCLAAIAHAECSVPPSSAEPIPDDATLWDSVWTHAMRRANVPAVSRAACHAAHILLLHSKRLLSSPRVLGEIESFVKDLDVQGPAYPYDSVCAFMILCLRFANQDVRLYRLQMEEKVLSWLTEAWRIDGGRRTAMPMHTVSQVHSLLEAIIGSSRRVTLYSETMLPPCPIVDAMVVETQTKVIRDFLLHARLPPFAPARTSTSTTGLSLVQSADDTPPVLDVESTDLSPPRGRERRLSAFMLKSSEALCALLAAGEGSYSKPTVEMLRSAFDLAVSAILFEASLLMNGTQPNRRVIQAACRLMGTVAPTLTDPRWEAEERRLLLGALDPLVFADETDTAGAVNGGWEGLVGPGKRSGIRTQVLQKLLFATQTNDADRTLRYALQRCVFRSADVQDAFADLLKRLRELLRTTIAGPASKGSNAYANDFNDDFAPSLGTAVSTEATQKSSAVATHESHIARTCVTTLVIVPILQSSSGEPTHDKDLLDLLLQCEPGEFLLVAPPCLDHIEQKRLHLSRSNMKDLLQQVGDLCSDYVYKNMEAAQLLVVRVLEATAHLWRGSYANDEEVGGAARFYCTQCVELLRRSGRRSLRLRDAIVRFLGEYLAVDPTQEAWSLPIPGGDPPEPDDFPAAILPTFADDVDIRIRFRFATISPRLLPVGSLAGRETMEVYRAVHRQLCADQYRYESIISRFLCLGNIIISEASVRRGALWHLLEVACFTETYHAHLKSVLLGIIARLGIEKISDLFESYAAQFAYSMRASKIDIFRFPPELLGYRDRRECAQATFASFTPTNLLSIGSTEERVNGRELFVRHCQAIQRSEDDGVRMCFADLVGHMVTMWFDTHDTDEDVGNDIRRLLQAKTRLPENDELLQELLQQNIDHIAVAILRTLGDHDVTDNGPIVAALQESGALDAREIFRTITRYRTLDTFEPHTPNLPRYGAHLVLQAIEWYRKQIRDADSPAVTYHVLHHLFADIERSLLVNEQYRLLNALCLWISYHHTQFRDACLIRVLMRRTTALLAQSDLARSAQSLLEWALSLYKMHTPKPDHRLADILIRASTVSHDFLESREVPFLVELGRQLMPWAEKQAEELLKSKTMRRQVIRALAAWPRELPPSLRAACDSIRLADLIKAPNEPGITSSKFRLVRKIQEVAFRGKEEGTEDQFSQSNFWRLKACIPPREYLFDSDIDAFTALLIMHHGRIDSVGGEQFTPVTVCVRHRQGVEAAPRANEKPFFAPHADVAMAHSAVVLSLLAMLDSSPAPRVHTVYTTLRAIMSAPTSETFVATPPTTEIRQELDYMCAFRRPRVDTVASDIHTVLAGEELLHLASQFPQWVARVATLLCEVLGVQDPFFAPLVPLLQADHVFAEEVLPVLIHSILQIEVDRSASAPASPNSLRALLSTFFSAVLAYPECDVSCYRAIINVVLHLRSFQPLRDPKDALAHDKWLSVDFALLGHCATRCGAYTTALVFLELSQQYPHPDTKSYEFSTEDVLFEIYSHIDEPDGFYGIQTDDLRNFFVKRLRHENQWDKAFRYHGAVLESGAGGPVDTDGIVQSLYSFGFNRLAMNTLQQFSDSNDSLGTGTLAYNLGWRSESWDLPETLASDHSGSTLYLAMRAVYRERNMHAVDAVVQRAFAHEMQRLRNLGSENFTEIRQVTQNLMCLSQIRRWRSDDAQKELQAGRVNDERWQSFTRLEPEFDLRNIEAIMATRISLIRSLRQKEQRDQIGDLVSPFSAALLDLERACLLCVSERARDATESQLALNSVVRAQHLEKKTSPVVTREFSNVLWLMKEPKLAIKSLSSLLSVLGEGGSVNDAPSRLQRASLLAQLGMWSAEASMKKPSHIVDEYFSPAVGIITAPDLRPLAEKDSTAASIFHQYAIFAERQYHSISKSPDALRWKLYIDRKKEEIRRRAYEMTRLAQHSPEFLSLLRAQKQAEQLLKQDQERAQEHLGQRTSFLVSAIEMYSRCLAASDAFDDDSPIRLCSLWLANFDNHDATLRFGDALHRVPSRKLVFLAHQLTARLWSTEGTPSDNQTILRGVIQRMCSEHPFHSLFPLYCLKGDRPLSQPSSRRQSGRHSSQESSQVERYAAVAEILDKLRTDPQAGKRLQDVELVCDASLEWAKYPLKASLPKNKRIPKSMIVPEKLIIRRIKDIKVPVITAHVPVDPTTEYRECPWIVCFDQQFSTAGGINLPKIIKCHGADGKWYKQLYKGEGDDDLRQDAVMEQVFDLVNVVLHHDRETKRRQLSVRGYKVVPLGSQAGVLEFVENTTPLQEWLGSAHPRYRPQDLSHDYIYKNLPGQRYEWRDNPGAVIKRFLQYRERFKPVMRHYFTEKHKTPMAWYSMRLRYARSVATNSIVGHILGVGDRHTSNILIDNKTGEVVHIDLGIAFEQGKLLPQPERVPFRLTADMVDGLGMSGTQGVFQRCAEETLRVLRDGSEIILTVLEVFKYDPLHSWTASEIKMKRVQGNSAPPEQTAQLTGEAFRFAIGIDMESGAADEAADRALSAVARKLDKTLSVEYTVNELITEAADPTNIALMYIGESYASLQNRGRR
ncbi:hypothetical protein C8Q77DRAFT_1063237 [Trametes polyzona]|nr:hypothetical protein C8Q77DRAFT_1063237 [Trametes polyzona]